MKAKATVIFNRHVRGKVTVREIVNEDGIEVLSKSFGIMSDDEYRKNLKTVQLSPCKLFMPLAGTPFSFLFSNNDQGQPAILAFSGITPDRGPAGRAFPLT